MRDGVGKRIGSEMCLGGGPRGGRVVVDGERVCVVSCVASLCCPASGRGEEERREERDRWLRRVVVVGCSVWGSETIHPQGNTIRIIMVAITVPSAAAWYSADCMSNGDDHCDYYYCTACATRHQVHNAWCWRDAVDSLRQIFHRPCMHSAS